MHHETIFLTGATGLLGGAVLERLLRENPALHAYVLVRDPARWDTAVKRHRIPGDRTTAVIGDVRLPGLGLDPAARARLAEEATAVLHLAADVVFSRTLSESRATNVAGTRHLLELCGGWPGLRRFAYASTAFVAGRRTGCIRESDIGGEAGWVNAYEQSKWEAEQLVRSSGLDWVNLRSSTIVCDSAAGEVSQFNAVHWALRLYHHGLAPMIPGRESTPVDLVTAEYVSDAIARLALREGIGGQTFHLCAGAGAIPLGELLDTAHAIWAEDPAWKRKGISRPALAELRAYQLFEASVEEAGDARLRQVLQSLSHFAPQLALEKRFDTSDADALLGTPAPPVRSFLPQMIRYLVATNWTTTLRVAA